MITHGNIVATAAAGMSKIPKLGVKDVYLAYLPLAHVYELAAEVTIPNRKLSFHEFWVHVHVLKAAMIFGSMLLSCRPRYWLQEVLLVMDLH